MHEITIGGTSFLADDAGRVAVWDTENDQTAWVTVREAALGMLRYARSLGAGTVARAVVEQRALAVLRAPLAGSQLAAETFAYIGASKEA